MDTPAEAQRIARSPSSPAAFLLPISEHHILMLLKRSAFIANQNLYPPIAAGKIPWCLENACGLSVQS
jgi:hypothetical protein